MYTFASIFWPRQSRSLNFLDTHFAMCLRYQLPADQKVGLLGISGNLFLPFSSLPRRWWFHLSQTKGCLQCNYTWKLHRFLREEKFSLFPVRQYEIYFPCSHLELLEFWIGSGSVLFKRTKQDSFTRLRFVQFNFATNIPRVLFKKSMSEIILASAMFGFVFLYENALQVPNYCSIKRPVSFAAAIEWLLNRTAAARTGSWLVSELMEKRGHLKMQSIGELEKWTSELRLKASWKRWQSFPSDKLLTRVQYNLTASETSSRSSYLSLSSSFLPKTCVY